MSVTSRQESSYFLDHLNYLRPTINLTMDYVFMPFVDVKIERSCNGLRIVPTYGQPTYTDQYLNFQNILNRTGEDYGSTERKKFK